MRKQYPSDITRKQFEQIRKDLSNARKTTHVTDHLSQAKKLLTDDGYTGMAFANTIKSFSGMEVEVVKRSKLHTFEVIPKR